MFYGIRVATNVAKLGVRYRDIAAIYACLHGDAGHRELSALIARCNDTGLAPAACARVLVTAHAAAIEAML